MTNPLARIKLGMLLFGCIVGGIVGVRELTVALLETEPTPIEIASFAADYDGQQWLEVHGTLAREHAGVRAGTHATHRRDGLGYVHVPVVPSDWHTGQPVAVLATFGPVALDEPIDWDHLCDDPACVSGQVRPVPLAELDELFPGLRFAGEPVIVNVGGGPAPPLGMGIFTLVMGLGAWAAGVALRNELRERGAR